MRLSDRLKVSRYCVDHSVVIAVGSNISVTGPDKYEIVRQVKGELILCRSLCGDSCRQ